MGDDHGLVGSPFRALRPLDGVPIRDRSEKGTTTTCRPDTCDYKRRQLKADVRELPLSVFEVKQMSQCDRGYVRFRSVASHSATQRFGRFGGKSGHGADTGIRSLMTHNVTSGQNFVAVQHMQRAAIPTYKCAISYSIISSAMERSVGGTAARAGRTQ
jgi:hypothetical protein